MTNCLDAGETVLYRLKKSKTPILFMVIFFPVWLYFAGMFLIPYCRSLFSGASGLNPDKYLLSGLAGLIVFIPIVLIIFLSYAGNGLVITDRRAYVRKGLTGRTLIVNLGDIRSFQHAYSTKHHTQAFMSVHHRSHRIYFYLNCGRLVKTGNLFITHGSLQALLTLLRERFEGKGFSRRELRLLGGQNPGAGFPMTRTNLFVPILVLAPFILALLAAAGYLADKMTGR